MPEGHTIHRLAGEHNALLAGRPVRTSSPQGRFAAGAGAIDGTVVERVLPYGKHLFYEFAGDRIVHVHLGLYGGFELHPQPAPEPRGAVRWRIETVTACLDLRGPTACEVLDPPERDRILARLGPDPLQRGARADRFRAAVARRATPVGALLLDQSVIAGVGNVFRAEALYRLGVSPWRPASRLAPAQVDALWDDVRLLMRAGVRNGRIVTTLPADRPRGARRGLPDRAEAHYVYRRTGLPCRRCGTPVATAELAARTIYWCPVCQPA